MIYFYRMSSCDKRGKKKKKDKNPYSCALLPGRLCTPPHGLTWLIDLPFARRFILVAFLVSAGC